ncbi:hypothetical protein AB0C96_35540 [Streptomyces sp. NPDC048506]|uniref:hypothetical protein n=1 Tax=Streptomyces sp. NPDC048506 TaxID=3155028 RepID=UPI0034416FFF
MPAGTWTDEVLDRMRGTGDAAGDAAISETYELGRQEEVRQALRGFGKNSEVPADAPATDRPRPGAGPRSPAPAA